MINNLYIVVIRAVYWIILTIFNKLVKHKNIKQFALKLKDDLFKFL